MNNHNTNNYCHTCLRTTPHKEAHDGVACDVCGREQEWADWWLEKHSEVMDALAEIDAEDDARRCVGCHGCVTPCGVRLGKK